MLQACRQYIEKKHLLLPGEQVLVAVSGGIDSVVLFHLLKELGYSVAVAHCNFGLRGEESDRDEAFVRELAHKAGCPVFVERCDTTGYVRQKKVSVQEAARTLRYDFFNRLVRTTPYDKVALAHNADDDLEGFFINLARVTGLKGLTGMPVKRLPFVRPLLFASRKEIEIFALENRIEWREDSSNAGNKYLRNRIRHLLIPALKEVQPDFSLSIRRSMDNLAEADELFRMLLKEKREQLLHDQGDTTVIDVTPRFYGHKGELLLYYLLKPFGFDRNVVSQLAAAITIGDSGKWFFSSGYRLLLDRQKLILAQKKSHALQSVWIYRSEGVLTEPLHLKLTVKPVTEINFSRNPMKAWFDADQLTFPLEIRPWKQGDRIVPFGKKRSKPVSDVLTNNKLSLIDKEKVYVLLSGDEVLWVVKWKNSSCCRVTPATKNVLEVEVLE